MAFLTEDMVRSRARLRARNRGKSVDIALNEEARVTRSEYDIFLSQTIHDREIVYGVYAILTEDLGLRVFCDWIERPELDRSLVTVENAEYIRAQMRRSEALVFVDTENAVQSKWMCWELGYFDGENGHVAVLPVVKRAGDPYRGREFLGLYPVVEYDDVHGVTVTLPEQLLARILTPGRVYGMATRIPLRAFGRAPPPFRSR